MRTGCHGNVTKSGRGWIVLFEELTEVRMDAETSEGAVSQPTENEPEPPSAEQVRGVHCFRANAQVRVQNTPVFCSLLNLRSKRHLVKGLRANRRQTLQP